MKLVVFEDVLFSFKTAIAIFLFNLVIFYCFVFLAIFATFHFFSLTGRAVISERLIC